MLKHHKKRIQCFTNIASIFFFLAACFSFSSATSPTCLTLSLDKPMLKNQQKKSNEIYI